MDLSSFTMFYRLTSRKIKMKSYGRNNEETAMNIEGY